MIRSVALLGTRGMACCLEPLMASILGSDRLRSVTDAINVCTLRYPSVCRSRSIVTHASRPMPSRVDAANDVTSTRPYDAACRLTAIADTASGGETVSSFDYTFDAVGNPPRSPTIRAPPSSISTTQWTGRRVSATATATLPPTPPRGVHPVGTIASIERPARHHHAHL